MFRGEYRHNIDVKGRIVLPVKFREVLGKHFIITKNYWDKCLLVYTVEEWEIFEGKLKALPMSDPHVRKIQRFFLGSAVESEPDGQGRAVLPQNLREYAGISKEVVTLGVSNRIEIWSKENWDSYNDEDDFKDEALTEKMAQIYKL